MIPLHISVFSGTDNRKNLVFKAFMKVSGESGVLEEKTCTCSPENLEATVDLEPCIAHKDLHFSIVSDRKVGISEHLNEVSKVIRQCDGEKQPSSNRLAEIAPSENSHLIDAQKEEKQLIHELLVQEIGSIERWLGSKVT